MTEHEKEAFDAMREALIGLLESHAMPSSVCKERPAHDAAYSALAAANAVEQQAQELVAWRYEIEAGVYRYCRHKADTDMVTEFGVLNPVALYAAPKAQGKQEPVAWMLEWTFDGEEKGQRLYDDERHCLLDAEKDGGICRPLVYGDISAAPKAPNVTRGQP